MTNPGAPGLKDEARMTKEGLKHEARKWKPRIRHSVIRASFDIRASSFVISPSGTELDVDVTKKANIRSR
jgi:hypothetical protein